MRNNIGAVRKSSLVVGGITLIVAVVIAIVFPIIRQSRERSAEVRCICNVKQLCGAMIMYSIDNGNRFPLKDNWCDVLRPYMKSEKVFKEGYPKHGLSDPFMETAPFIPLERVYRCPSAPSGRCAYAYSADLSGAHEGLIEFPSAMVCLFDADLRWNGSGGKERLALRHDRGAALGFVDGHAAWSEQAEYETWTLESSSIP